MDQTLFYWTWNGIKHHFLNIKQIRTCSSIGNQTWTTYSSPLTNEHQTDLLIDLSNYPSVETERNFARNSLGSLENFGCQTRSLARSSARSQLHIGDGDQVQACSKLARLTQKFWLSKLARSLNSPLGLNTRLITSLFPTLKTAAKCTPLKRRWCVQGARIFIEGFTLW